MHCGWANKITFTNLKPKEIEKLVLKVKKPRKLVNRDSPHPLYLKFKADTDKITRMIYDTNPEFVEKVHNIGEILVVDSDKCFSKLRNRVMSYYCGTIENKLTMLAYKYFTEHGVCKKQEADWGYDGFTFPHPSPDINLEYHLDEMVKYVREKSGFQRVHIICKPFESENMLHDVIQARQNYCALRKRKFDDSTNELNLSSQVLEAIEKYSKVKPNMIRLLLFIKYLEAVMFVLINREKNFIASITRLNYGTLISVVLPFVIKFLLIF